MSKKKTFQHVTHTPELINPEATNTATNVHSGCAEITFVNLDTVNIAYVNGYPLGVSPAPGIPGGFIAFGDNLDEIEDTNFSVVCAQPAGQLGLWVWRKYYTKTSEREV